ncbi:hypothetical protein QBZ16_001699 [Prototheca wickerhamii]|uniref:Leucine carboxyl methyltransferase 1 homolog n=1 Tax=Prototheca wickerhamii TaxID=3111 RepID=A0AAD9ID02_PROWI|nr:hypothetical protein QBZ16_001699 [Prototheca wickerhamii]
MHGTGYYARYAALRQLLAGFAATLRGAPFQILSIGAGFDTSFWQLQGSTLDIRAYTEIDVPAVCLSKARIIGRNPELMRGLQGEGARASAAEVGARFQSTGPQIENLPRQHPAAPSSALDSSPAVLKCGAYRLAAADLRHPDQVERALAAVEFDPSLPCFVLSECVLVYLEPEESAALLRQLARALPTVASKRLLDAGWDRAGALDMNAVYRRRIERLEIFDEFEEWNLIQAHYCIALGIKDGQGVLQGFGLEHVFHS